MKIHEYQGKEILKKYGVAVPRGEVAFNADDARAIAERHADLFERLVNEGDATLRRSVSYRNSAGRDFRNTVEEIVTHVTMHGSYHRGQIARIVRASPSMSPATRPAIRHGR